MVAAAPGVEFAGAVAGVCAVCPDKKARRSLL